MTRSRSSPRGNRRTKYSYDALGRQEKLGAYASSDGSGSPTNEVQYAYNELGQLAREYQAHTGAVDTNATPYVAYMFSDDTTAGVLDHPRLLSVRYPSGRLVQYRYGAPGSRDDLLSRLASVHDDNPTAPGTAGQMLTSYAYNGLNRIIQEAYPQPGVTLDYIGDTPGVYAGFDRFGRVQDQNWRTAGTNSLDRFNYGHDFNGNRIFRRNVLAEASLTPKDWAYGYDAFNQLTAANRGRLQDPPSGQLVASSTNAQQSWNLDQAGNWSGFMEGTGVAWTLDQARSNNKVNEITNITATAGAAWVTPVYDARGNMTSGPQPGNETNRLQFVHDAWNRLVQVKTNGTVLATYRYDAVNRRIAKLLGANPASPDASFDYFYNNTWQTLEVRKNSSLHEQYVWSVRYLDAPVLRDRDA
ncbi:MAG: hypothetical protein NTV49_11105, partial [Kiritimatiellaeota bacterium]|nr:hypothetical protein [Kiritimatiellota bacterium]